MSVLIKYLDGRHGQQWPFPRYETDGSAGIDLRACIDSAIVIYPYSSPVLIPSGIALGMDGTGLAAIVIPRSGLGHKSGLVLGNLVGLIDSDYHGEVMISCWNRGTASVTVNPGDRIAQLVFVPVARPILREVSEFSPSMRGGNGFGSSGIE